MSIFGIMALGIGAFAGVITTTPSMIETAQNYVEEHRLFDFRLISTWGFTQEDIAGINELELVRMARGNFSVDFIHINEEGDEQVLRTHSICADINRLSLVVGRLPVNASEIVLDYDHFSRRKVGEEIQVFCYGNLLSEDNELEWDRDNQEDPLARNTFIVTGLVRSPLYMNLERGITTIGGGRVRGFGYLLPEAFTSEFYHQAYVYLESDYRAFTEEYDNEIERVEGELEEAVFSLIEERVSGEINELRIEIERAKEELEDKISQVEGELYDALAQVEEGEEELATAKEELEAAREEIEERASELEQAISDLETARRNYQTGRDNYTESRRLYDEALREFNINYANYVESRRQFEEQRDAYRALVAAGMPPDPVMEQQIVYYEGRFNEAAIAFAAGRAELDATGASLDQVGASLREAYDSFEETQEMIEEGEEELEEALASLESGERELISQEEQLAEARLEIEEGMENLQEEIEDASAQLIEAEERLEDLDAVQLFVLNRHTNLGYAYFEGDIDMVESIARVFPIFFLLIAALVCSTTMTRMIDEEHSQIGTYRAMGYGKGAILGKYIIYSGTAALLGGLVGFIIGIQVFPRTIWMAYSMLYRFASRLILVVDYWLLLICLVVAVVCSVGMTLLACRIELRKVPAELIRPKMPSKGKRVWLERIPFLWRNMKFLHKVTARNIFRFKKRMLMMIMGIAGCMALVLAGLGLRDSINGVIEIQYNQIFHYDISVSYSRRVSETKLNDLMELYGEDIGKLSVVMQRVVTVSVEEGSKNVNLLVEGEDNLEGLISFQMEGVYITPPNLGEIAIDNRLASAGNLSVGDEIILQIGDTRSAPVRVSGIFENYIMYYAWMSARTFEDIFEDYYYEGNTLKMDFREGADEFLIASWLSAQSGVTRVLVMSILKSQVGNMLDSLDYVVMSIIVSAAALAFIVLFNLGNINISERVREIATLKVLGFLPRETASYVFRENFILTLIGMALGIPLGIWFHEFIMSNIHIDMLSFRTIIHPLSYLFAVGMVFVFSMVVDIILRSKLEGIKMAESLKAVE